MSEPKDEILRTLSRKSASGDYFAAAALLALIDTEPQEEQERIYEMLGKDFVFEGQA